MPKKESPNSSRTACWIRIAMPQVASRVSSRRPYSLRTTTRSISKPINAVTMNASGIATKMLVPSQMPDSTVT
jgi:hypothetical protein